MTVNSSAETGVATDVDKAELPYFEIGEPVKSVPISVDHAIVKHFSEHLYSSPNKAIEELVSNGFDALATHCYVYLPGEYATGQVVVWDDGQSMTVNGIEEMWQIARSPKELLGEGRVVSAEGRTRAVIGKFGIGKLASYAVGHRISHICKNSAGEYLAVSVDYRQFTGTDESPNQTEGEVQAPAPLEITADAPGPLAIKNGSDAEPSKDVTAIRAEGRPKEAALNTTSVRALTEEQALAVARTILPNGDALDYMLQAPHWTLAVIDDLRLTKPLYPGRLAWILGSGMPLRPDFQVWVDDLEVKPRLASNAAVTWQINADPVVASMRSAWQSTLRNGEVEGEVDYAPDPPADDSYEATEPYAAEPALVFPTLGRVTADIRLFADPLPTRADEGRRHGFFLMVRGRLVNPDDDKIFLNDPSFGTFYRSQFVIRADGVDAELLADRESLRRDTVMAREFKALQRALYLAARTAIDSQDEVVDRAAKAESWLPTRSRELFRDPMAALFSRAVEKPTSIDLNDPVIARSPLGETEPLATLQATNGHLQVNTTHPFYRAMEARAGGGKKGASVMRAFDLFAVAERLTEGHLYGMGIDELQVQGILEWRDKLFRALAETYDRNHDDAILELRNASYDGDTRFENAVAVVLRLMGFSATRDGASGKKDVLVVAPVGPGHRSFIAEAKGSIGAVANVTAAVASAANHRDATEGATHAVIIAREFTGFERKDDPAVLEECRATGGVSLVTVDVLVRLHEALLQYAYPLKTLMDVLFELESPQAKLRRVAELEKPLEDFDFRAVLEEIWSQQSGRASGDQVPIRGLWQSRDAWKRGMELSTFTSRLTALSHFAGHLMVLDSSSEMTVFITQHPDYVAEHVQRRISPPGIDALLGERPSVE